jgi:hypothetical protein
MDQGEAPADDFAALVQPREQRPVLWVYLLNPAEQGNGGALDIAPPVLSRSRCLQWPWHTSTVTGIGWGPIQHGNAYPIPLLSPVHPFAAPGRS